MRFVVLLESLFLLVLSPPFSSSESELSDDEDEEEEDEDEDEEDDEEDDEEELELLLRLFCSSGFFPFVDCSICCLSWVDDGDWPVNRSPGGSLLCDWLPFGDLERAGSSRKGERRGGEGGGCLAFRSGCLLPVRPSLSLVLSLSASVDFRSLTGLWGDGEDDDDELEEEDDDAERRGGVGFLGGALILCSLSLSLSRSRSCSRCFS